MKIFKLMLRLTLILTGSAVLLGAIWACSSYGPSPAGMGTPEAAEAPKLFNEAPVPEGWPALTPVNEVRVKQYPAYRAAVIEADDQSGSSSGMFRPLFNHIKRQDIAMTAPVEMTYHDNGRQSSMAFLYRTAGMGSKGADSDDSRINVRDIPEMRVLSIGVQGGYTHSRFEDAVQVLNDWLNDNDQYVANGQPRYLGYNSPFIPSIMRYGEVQIPLK